MLPEKIMAPWYNHPKGGWEIEEALRFKNREKLQEALMVEMQRLQNEGCMRIHCFLVSSDWFDIQGTKKEDLDYDWAFYSDDKIEHYKDGVKQVYKDDRPSPKHMRTLATGCIPAFEFCDLPVYIIPYLKTIGRDEIVLAVPK